MMESNWLWWWKNDTYLGIILQLDGIACKVGRGSNPHPNLHLTPSRVHPDLHCHTQPQLCLDLMVILLDCNCFVGACIWRRCVLTIVFRTTQRKNMGVLQGWIKESHSVLDDSSHRDGWFAPVWFSPFQPTQLKHRGAVLDVSAHCTWAEKI